MSTNNSSGKRLSAREKIAMAAGAVTAVAGSATASASIVYVDNSPLFQSAYDGQGSSTNWDVDGDGGADFQLWVRSSNFNYSANNFPFSARYSSNFYGIVNFASAGRYGEVLNGRGVVGAPGRANALSSNVQIGPTLAGGYQWNGNGNVEYRSAARVDSSNKSTRNYNYRFVTTTASGGGYSTFSTTTQSTGNQRSGPGIDFQTFVTGADLLGFRFETEGELFYGWAEINISGSELGITRWAYEDEAGRGIRAGATVSADVPEPATLALLGMGAAGLLAFRGRRKKEEMKPDA